MAQVNRTQILTLEAIEKTNKLLEELIRIHHAHVLTPEEFKALENNKI